MVENFPIIVFTLFMNVKNSFAQKTVILFLEFFKFLEFLCSYNDNNNDMIYRGQN